MKIRLLVVIAFALLSGCVHMRVASNVDPRGYCVDTIDHEHCVLDESPQSPWKIAEAKRTALQHKQRIRGRIYAACALAATAACYAFIPGCIEKGGTKMLLFDVPATIGGHYLAEQITDRTGDPSTEEFVDNFSMLDCLWDVGQIATHMP